MTIVARAISGSELTLLRTPGDWTRAFLAIYKPNVIYTARLNGAPTSTDMVGEITFDGGSGTLANVKAEMTLWVGSTAGARDLGVCRIRKAPIAGTIYISHTSEIEWADNCYLTIVDCAMLSAKPVMVESGVAKMDGEHVYSDQHEDFDPVPVLSCHAVGTLVDGEVAFHWDATNSWVFGSTITDYLWEAPGSLSISDETSGVPVITYDSAGNHPVYCTVTAENGKSATGIQFAFRFDAENLPHRGEIQAPSADYDSGGWEFKAKMFSDADPTEIIEGALCVLFADDYYGSTKQSIGQIQYRENIICWGWIGDEDIAWDAETSSVEFTVHGPHYWLDKIEVNPIKLSMGTISTLTWDLMPALTVDRYIWHVLHWRSNATALLSVTVSFDTRYAPKLEADGTLWAQMNDVAWRKIFGRLGCDRYGRLFVVVDPQCVQEASRTWATVMTITKTDWVDQVQVKRNTTRRLSMLSTSGWVVDISGATSTLYSLAMGHINARHGGSTVIDQLLTFNQAQFNALTGLYMGWKNNQLEFDFKLSQNNRIVDLWPNQYLAVALAAEDTPRGIAYEGNLIPRAITLQPDQESGAWSTEISCEAETFAELAVNGDIPAADDFDSSYPPEPDFPPMPDIPPLDLPPTEQPENQPKVIVAYSSNFGVVYTKDFDVESPTWYFMNSGLLPDDKTSIQNLIITPAGALYLYCSSSNVYRATGLGGTWMSIASIADFPNGIHSIGVNPTLNDTIIIVGLGLLNVLGYTAIVTNGVMIITVDNLAMRYVSGTSVWSAGKWVIIGSHFGLSVTPYLEIHSADGTPEAWNFINTAVGQDVAQRYAQAMGTSDTIIQWDSSGAGGYNVITNGGMTVVRSTDITPAYSHHGLSFSPTGNFGMGAYGTTPYKTPDGGTTWESAAGVIPLGCDIWENCRDDFRWVFKHGNVVALTMDFGTSYVDKGGNLYQIAPLMLISGIRFIE